MSSGKEDYQEEDVVFAMVTGYPWWPGFIAEKYSRKQYKVTFFGDFSYAELSVKQIKPFLRGLKKTDPNNEELMYATQSAKKVFNGESTIEKEHEVVKEKMKEESKKSRKTKGITKKKKSSRKSRRSRRAEKKEEREREREKEKQKEKEKEKKKIKEKDKDKNKEKDKDKNVKSKVKKKGRSVKGRERNNKLSQSLIQETTHKRKADRMNQKKREAKLGKSMDQKLIEESEAEEEEEVEEDKGRMILEELEEESAREEAKDTVKKSVSRRKEGEDEQSQMEGDLKIKEEEEVEEKEKIEEEGLGEEEKEKEVDSQKPTPKKSKKSSEKNKKFEKSEKNDEIEKAESPKIKEELPKSVEEKNSIKEIKSEKKEEGVLEEVTKPIKLVSASKSVEDANSEEKEEGDRFGNFEKNLLNLLKELQGNQPIPDIEKSLKEWFERIAEVNHFSPIVSTEIGKYLSQMTKICMERINEKQLYTQILNDIKHLKLFIIDRISKNFFNVENLEDPPIQNEDSIVTTKKNDSASKGGRRAFPEQLSFGMSNINLKVRERIQKKLAKRISKMATRNSIKKETCLLLGKRMEEFLYLESREQEEVYRENVLHLLEYMDAAQAKFIQEFIFQNGSKCDVQVLKRKIKALLSQIN
jgi:hypothetical protein